MKFTYTLAVLIAFFAAAHAGPDNDFCNDKNNGYFADPKNCIYYYHCFDNAVEARLICPNEGGVQQLYDPTHIWCDYPNKVDCGDRPICDENDENCNAAPTTDPTAPTKAPFVCPEPSGYFADPNNCMKYYHCYDGVPEEHLNCGLDEAGKQELWDIGHNWCDHPERVDCGDRPICDKNDENCNEPSTPSTKSTPPTPDFECPQPNGYFADPTNCIKYYHCYENVVEARITCPKANGKQECFDPVNTWCDWPERVDCGSRPICDEYDQNCITPTTTTPYTGPTTPTTTPKPDNCAKYGSCTMDQDGQGPYHAEGPCEQCFCQCVAAGFYSEVCCQPGLLFNESIEECDFPTNMPDCN